MGQEVSKPVRHRKFDHPTIVNSNKSGNVGNLGRRDQAKDKKCMNISQKLINGDIRVCRYLEVVVKIMGEYW